MRPGERRRPVAQREVEAVALEVLDFGVRSDAHVDAGVLAREAREARDQPERGEGMRGGHGERLLARLRAQPVGCSAHRREGLRRRGVELVPRLGQRKRAMPPLEQRHAELVLELLDLAAHRRLREVELLARLGEGEVARGRFEPDQEVEGW